MTNRREAGVSKKFKLMAFSLVKIPAAVLLVISFLLLPPAAAIAAEKEVLIGILAKRGGERTLQKWQPTADYLNKEIPWQRFRIIPLGFDVISTAVAAGEVDFILANSSFYVELEARYGVKRIATLRNKVGNIISTEFGGVIFSRADRGDINTIDDLKGRSLMAVNENSLGGFHMAWGELQSHNIDPYKDVSKLAFGGTHDAVVHAVLQGRADVGTVRTDTLERMAQEGQINLTDFKLITHHIQGDKADFPFLHSTALYPEWPFASLTSTPTGLSQTVAVALLRMPPESEAAMASKSAGWDIPLNYQPVHELLKKLRVGIYQDFGIISVWDVLRLYWHWLFFGILLLSAMAMVTSHVSRLNEQLKISRRKLQDATDTLELRVERRTYELENKNIELEYVLEEYKQTLDNLQQTSRDKRLLLDSAGEGIYGLDSDGKVIFANSFMVNRLGWSEDELIGNDIHTLTHHTRINGEPYPSIECPIHSSLRQLTVHQNSDEIFWCKDGSSFPVEYTSTPIIEDGVQKGVVVVFRDITVRKQTEDALHRTDKMDALGQLTGGIAHDFNNMLGVILGYSDLLRRKIGDDPKLEQFSKQIHLAGERAKKLTSKLLAFSRKETSTAESTNINEVIQESHHMLERTITARIELILELADDLWPVWIDASSLEDAILNMSINAMHAIPESGSLTLSTKAMHLEGDELPHIDIEAGDYVLLTLTDTGAGMSQETLQHVFDPFYSTKGAKGTGLGMSQVYGFVQQSKGVIHIDSEEGQGTAISIYFPRHQQISESVTTGASGAESVTTFGHETILVVDDEPTLRELAEEILTSHGYQVVSAGSGEQALKILENGAVDLLFTDVIMPDMDGYHLAEKVLADYPLIKIQLTSGFSDTTDKEKNDRLKQKLLKKPYTPTQLLHTVRENLDKDADAIASELLQPVIWSEQISTGIELIDEDHKILVMLLNRCIEAINSGNESGIKSSVLGELLDYISYHFQREEVLMEICKFPDISAHKKEHRRMLAKVMQLIKEHGDGQLTTGALLSFMRDWLTDHISSEQQDRAIIPYCQGKDRAIKQGLKEAGLHSLSKQADS